MNSWFIRERHSKALLGNRYLSFFNGFMISRSSIGSLHRRYNYYVVFYTYSWFNYFPFSELRTSL